MAKAIINKHIDEVGELARAVFLEDIEKAKGELVICNDPNNPTIYILDSNGSIRKLSGNSEGSNYDDSEIWLQVNKNKDDIADLKANAPFEGVLQEDIVVAGLDEQFGAGNYKNGDIIVAGTPYQTIFTNFLCKELYPNVSTTKASASAIMNALTLTLDVPNNVNGKCEVGTLVKLTKCETNGCSASTRNSSITGMTYGYSAANDNSQDSKDTSISVTCVTSVSDNNYSISATIDSGFDADETINIKTVPATKTGTGKAELQETNIGCVNEGVNKISVLASGASFAYTAQQISDVYYCSNLGHTDSNKKIGVESVNGITSKGSKAASEEVTGAYYYFMGYSNNTSFDQFDSESVRALNTKSGWLTMNGTTEVVGSNIMTSNGKSIVIACPSKYKLNSINYSNQADMMSKFSSVGEVDVKTGEIITKYKVYVYPITNNTPVEFTNVSIGKA